MERMRKMMEKMSEEERAQMMERCFEFMKGKEPGKNKERDEKNREESACFADIGKLAECRPEMMEALFSNMMGCFGGKGKEETKETDEKTKNSKCC